MVRQTQENGFGHSILASSKLIETGEAAPARTLTCGKKTGGTLSC